MLERIFALKERGTTITREAVGGAVTFLTMAYIIFTQPLMMALNSNGWATFDFATGAANDVFMAIMVGTCAIAGLASIFMAFTANIPVALAPGMGLNVMFATMMGMAHIAPEEALGVIFVSGVIFFIVSFFKLREFILGLITPSQQAAIVVGIGLFILVWGLLMSAKSPGFYDVLQGVFIYEFSSTHLIVFLINFGIIGLLLFLRIPGALFFGIAAGAIIAWFFNLLNFGGLVGAIPSIDPTVFKIDILGALKLTLIPYIAIFLYVDMFETMATLIGVTRKAKLVDENGNIPGASRALRADAFGTLGGSLLGISPVTCYIESSAGVVSGARTGLASVVTGLLFLISLFFTPMWLTLASNVVVGPVLVFVGIFMMTELKNIRWSDWSDAVPAAVTMIVMIVMFSIADGLAAGFLTYPVCKAIAGQSEKNNWLSWSMAVLSLVMILVTHFIFV
jgi:AGZA family xanthine/uracil permease-like MFS transporter